MKKFKNTLNLLPISHTSTIKKINCNNSSKRRLLDLGLIENSKIKAVLKSPSKGLTAYSIRGTLIAIRDEDSSLIEIY